MMIEETAKKAMDEYECREVVDGYKLPQWQPIETAPKDGTTILASDGDVVMAVEYSCDDRHCWYPSKGGFNFSATHWQTLPEPPKE